MEYIVRELPQTLEPNATYYVQIPEAGIFNMYVTDASGVAVPLGAMEKAYKIANNGGMPSDEQILKITVELEEGIVELPKKWLPKFRSINPINYTQITLPNSLIRLGDNALEGYPLVSFKFPENWNNSPRQYGKYLFQGATLTEVPEELKDNLTEGMFMDSKVSKVPNSTEFPKNVFKGAEITEIKNESGAWTSGSLTIKSGAFVGRFPITNIESQDAFGSWEENSMLVDLAEFDMNNFNSVSTSSVSPFAFGSKIGKYVTNTTANSYSDNQTAGATIELLDLSNSFSIVMPKGNQPTFENVKRVKFPGLMTEYPDFKGVPNFNSKVIYDVSESDLTRITKIDPLNGRFDFTGDLELPLNFPGVSMYNYGKINKITVKSSTQLKNLVSEVDPSTVASGNHVNEIEVKPGNVSGLEDMKLLHSAIDVATSKTSNAEKIKKISGEFKVDNTINEVGEGSTLLGFENDNDGNRRTLPSSVNISDLKIKIMESNVAFDKVVPLLSHLYDENLPSESQIIDPTIVNGQVDIVLGGGSRLYSGLDKFLIGELNTNEKIQKLGLAIVESDGSHVRMVSSGIKSILSNVKYTPITINSTINLGSNTPKDESEALRSIRSIFNGSGYSPQPDTSLSLFDENGDSSSAVTSINQIRRVGKYFADVNYNADRHMTLECQTVDHKENISEDGLQLVPIQKLEATLPDGFGLNGLKLNEYIAYPSLTTINLVTGYDSNYSELFTSTFSESNVPALTSYTLKIKGDKDRDGVKLTAVIPEWMTEDKIGTIGFEGASTKGTIDVTIYGNQMIDKDKFSFRETTGNSIKVSSDLVATYQADSKWSSMSDQITSF